MRCKKVNTEDQGLRVTRLKLYEKRLRVLKKKSLSSNSNTDALLLEERDIFIIVTKCTQKRISHSSDSDTGVLSEKKSYSYNSNKVHSQKKILLFR